MKHSAIHLLHRLRYRDFEQNVMNTVVRKSILNESFYYYIVVGGDIVVPTTILLRGPI